MHEVHLLMHCCTGGQSPDTVSAMMANEYHITVLFTVGTHYSTKELDPLHLTCFLQKVITSAQQNTKFMFQ